MKRLFLPLGNTKEIPVTASKTLVQDKWRFLISLFSLPFIFYITDSKSRIFDFLASGQTESANQRKEDFSNRKDPNFKDGNSTEQEREEYSTFEFEFITYSMEDDSATSNSVQRKKTDQAKLRSTRTYKCSICSEEFAKKKDLTVHHSSHPDFLSRSVTCSICSKIFSHVCFFPVPSIFQPDLEIRFRNVLSVHILCGFSFSCSS